MEPVEEDVRTTRRYTMSFSMNYAATMIEVANLAQDRNEPGYVRVRALVALVRELSPLNERHTEVKRELGIEETPSCSGDHERLRVEAYHQGVRDTLDSLEALEEEEAGDEDDEPP